MPAILLVFVAVAVGALLLTPSGAPARVDGRVAELAGTPAARHAGGRGWLRLLARLIEPLIRGKTLTRSLERALYQVGWVWSAGEFLVACGLLGLAAGLVVAVASQNLLVGALSALVAAAVPLAQLRQRRAKALQELGEQLPDALMLLINGLRAGNAFLAAMQLVAKQMTGPIAREFSTTVSEINWGLSVEDALNHLAERIATVDVDLVVSAVLVQRESGGNLSEILGNLHDTLRDRIRIKGEVHALTAQGRLSGIVLTSLPVGVGLLFYLVSPGYIGLLLTDPRGHMLLGGALAAQALGVLAIRRVVDVRY